MVSVFLSVRYNRNAVCIAANVALPPQGEYIDDIYYTPTDAHREANELKPHYKKGMKEIIFIDDTVSSELQDTITSQELKTTDKEENKR